MKTCPYSKLKQLQEEIIETARHVGRDPSTIQLVVISKGQSVDTIRQLFDYGIRDFGENRVQEAEEKQRLLPKEIRWHFIGTIQSKKVPKVVGTYCLIHSVDSLPLAEKISKKGLEMHLTTDILLEVNTSGEASKHGLTQEYVYEQFITFQSLPAIRVCGLMTMAAQIMTSDHESVRHSFQLLRRLKEALQPQTTLPLELSMGMSQDFKIAISEGATILRIGSRLFS